MRFSPVLAFFCTLGWGLDNKKQNILFVFLSLSLSVAVCQLSFVCSTHWMTRVNCKLTPATLGNRHSVTIFCKRPNVAVANFLFIFLVLFVQPWIDIFFWRERERNRECAYVCVWMWPICVSHTHSLSLNYMNCVEICMANLWILHVIRRIELNNKSRLDLYFSFFWFSDFFFVNFFCVTSVFRLYLDIVYFCHSSKLTFG